MSDRDRRSHPRFDILVQVTVRQGTVHHILSLLNISRGGALIDLGRDDRPRWLGLDREVELCVLDVEGHTALDLRGRIVRIEETAEQRTFAVRFDQLADEGVVRELLRVAGRPPPLPSGEPEPARA